MKSLSMGLRQRVSIFPISLENLTSESEKSRRSQVVILSTHGQKSFDLFVFCFFFWRKGWARFVRLILAETPRTQGAWSWGAQARLTKRAETKKKTSPKRGESETLTSASVSAARLCGAERGSAFQQVRRASA